MRCTKRERGISLLEVTIAGALLPVLLFAAFDLIRSGQNIDQSVRTKANLLERLRVVMRRIGDELRVASVAAEDKNGNGSLDSGEDLNGNGRLDSDWSVGADSITYNTFMPDGTFSLPVTYRLAGSSLVREFMTDTSTTQSTVVANNISEFSVTSSSESLTIELTTEIDLAGGATSSETVTMTVHPRN